MTLNQLVDALDAQIVKGDIIAAFDQFAADNCVTFSTPSDKTQTKAEKLEALRWFFNNVASVNRIERLNTKTGKNTTDSQFVFDFNDKFGNHLVYNEVIRRTWKGDKVVEEQYLMGATIESEQPAASAKTAASKKAEPVADKKPAAKKAAEPIADKKPATKSAKTAAKADDLVLIEGIGPKIAELLNAAGITTFAQLADTKPAAIKAILETAGKRYQMHDPATWPKQATLARDGKTAELAKLQDQLKAGRK